MKRILVRVMLALIASPFLVVGVVIALNALGNGPRREWLDKATHAIGKPPEEARALVGEPDEIHVHAAYPGSGSYTAWYYTVPAWDPLAYDEPSKIFITNGVVEYAKTPEKVGYAQAAWCGKSSP